MDEARSLAASVATGPAIGLGLMKRALQTASVSSLGEQLEIERDLQSRAGRTPDYTEGVLAFHQRRAARFSGGKEE